MAKHRVLDVGNCDPDHSSIRNLLHRHFDVDVHRVMFVHEAVDRLQRETFELVLVNRLIFADSSDGTELIRTIRRDPQLAQTRIMLVSNFKDAQARAVAEGALPGFGKAELNEAATHERLARHLPRRAAGGEKASG